MKRFWILLKTELKAWQHDPIPVLGGFLPPTILLIAFGLLFGGRLSFPIAVINHDLGPLGAALVETFGEVSSPFQKPYYQVLDLSEDQAWDAYHANRIDAVWVIPPDFSARLESGQHPHVDMYFGNYNDDRAKNHRLYSAEIMWHFYEKIGQPAPPLKLAEEYPRREMVDWFSIIGVGLVLLSIGLGGMFNVFMLTHKERMTKITTEFGMSPRPLAATLLPKVLLALLMGLVTGTTVLGILYLWAGVWPGRFLWAVWLLSALVALFWIGLALILGLRARHFMAGAIAAILTGVIVFFVGGGLSPVRYYSQGVQWFARLFPNTYAVDPLRELVLFHTWPENWGQTLLVVTAFAVVGLVAGLLSAQRQLRWLD
jgi:ABC-2 type transport system permease protein